MKSFLLAFFLGSIFSLFHISGFAIAHDDALVYKSMKKISYSMQKKYGMTGGICGYGKDGGFWKVTLDFKKDGTPPTLDEARKLVISCSEDIINFINQDEKIRLSLRDYPFGPKNIEIIIIFYTKSHDDIFHPYIGAVSSSSGRLDYTTFDPDYRCKEKTSIEETYEEALVMVRGQENPKNNPLKKDNSP